MIERASTKGMLKMTESHFKLYLTGEHRLETGSALKRLRAPIISDIAAHLKIIIIC